MLLAREFIAYLSRRLVERLTPQQIETTDPQSAIELFTQIITDELSAEDQLNEEVRDILDQYADYMRREGVSYQEMFRRIKNTSGAAAQNCSRIGSRHRRSDEALQRQDYGHLAQARLSQCARPVTFV